MPVKKKPQVKIPPKTKTVEIEEKPPKEKSAVETKDDFRLSMLEEKELNSAKNKFED